MKKRVPANWGKWVREHQQDKWLPMKVWSRYSFNNGPVNQLAIEDGVAEAVIQKFIICFKLNDKIRV